MDECEVSICGIPVNFPFKPYDVQMDYMNCVITCLNERRHGVLESPTGTGKTLSLLCSSLSWLQYYRMKKRNDSSASGCEVLEAADGSWGNHSPKIIYASRTHSQLRQVIKQFQTTSYKHMFRTTVIGSRDHMCVHATVKKEQTLSAKNMLCSALVKQKRCHYYNNVKNYVGHFDPIEEMAKPPDSIKCCPYYACREIIPSCDIIFMPYNYLLDMQTQKSLKFSLSETIIIIDEGHNIPKICEEAASVSITSSNIACCLVDITEEMQSFYDEAMLGNNEVEYSTEDLVFIHQILSKLEEAFQAEVISEKGKVFTGSYIFTLLGNCNVNIENYQRIIELLQEISDAIIAKHENSVSTKGMSLRKLADAIYMIFTTCDTSGMAYIEKSFKVFIEPEVMNSSNKWSNIKKSSSPKKVNYWCFNPGFSLGKLLDYKVRSIILTSGTLSPMEATIKELSLDNPVTLENDHIIKNEQVLVCTVGKGPLNVDLKCTYENRDNKNYWRELGMTIENVSRLIPDGLLVFFPSYITMKKANEMWSSNGLLQRLTQIKSVFIEPNDRDTMEEVMKDYISVIESDKRGAMLFAVCRGKISEGLDFSGKFARGVIITGIPFAPLFDPKVKLKKEFIDINKELFKGLTGDNWYKMDAMRAVNQAVGRVIRHSSDYGVVILCDSRFERSNYYQLPKWLYSKLSICTKFPNCIIKLREFFKNISSNSGVTRSPFKVASMYAENKECSFSINSQPSCSKNNLPQVLSASESHEAFNINKPVEKKLFVELARAAEETFNQQLLFNPSALEVNPNSNIEVKPAKKRKITIAQKKPISASDTRRTEIKNFIVDVKLNLDPESYTVFAFIIKKYQANNNFEETLSSLETLFLSDSNEFKELFKGCSRLFSNSHKEKFEEYVRKLL